VKDQHSKRKGKTPKHSVAEADSAARKKLKTLWQYGDLFHATTRYPRRPTAPRIDRLAGILTKGLVAPGWCQDGSVRSDLHILVTGCSVPYDSLIFLHRYAAQSYIYTMYEPGRFAVFIDPTIPVLMAEEMGGNWVELCQDEVYVRHQVPLEKLIGIAVHPADADSVMSEFLADFQRLQLPLYDYDGTVLWPGK
jgi:hypothetical protein